MMCGSSITITGFQMYGGGISGGEGGSGLHIECFEDQNIAGLAIAVVEYSEHEDELIRLCWGLNKPLLVQIAK